MKISTQQKDMNAKIALALISNNYGNEYIKCKYIQYYVNGNLVQNSPGEIAVLRRDNHPRIQIISSIDTDYTIDFWEDSCIYKSSFNNQVIEIRAEYTPVRTGVLTKIKVIFEIKE